MNGDELPFPLQFSSIRCRKVDGKSRAFADLADYCQTPTHGFRKTSSQSQPETRAGNLRLRYFWAAIKRFKDVLQLLRIDSHAMVCDGDADLACRALFDQPGAQPDPAFVPTIFDRIS